VTAPLSPQAFADRLAALAQGRPARLIAALAGPPGAGKSTIAEAVAARLNAGAPGRCAVLPMDGFHFDDLVLVPRGDRPRKGAPHTFDVGGLAALLMRLRANTEAEIAAPVFDRTIEIARAGARIIPQSVPILLVEGNYLLLRAAPWSGLRPLFDVTAMIAVAPQTLRARLGARWREAGMTEAETLAKLEENDLPNGRLVTAESVTPDLWVDGMA